MLSDVVGLGPHMYMYMHFKTFTRTGTRTCNLHNPRLNQNQRSGLKAQSMELCKFMHTWRCATL